MARPIVVLNCARNYEPGSLEQDMPRLLARCDVRLTEARDGPDLARELADADVLVARRDYLGRATLQLAASGSPRRVRAASRPAACAVWSSTARPSGWSALGESGG